MKFLFLSLSLLFTISILGQSGEVNRCGHDEWLEEYEEQHPGYTDQILKGLQDFKNKKISEKRSSATITIPVHVILVHSPGQPEGSGTNFTLEHVQSQIDVINQDFGYYNSDAGNTPADFSTGDTGIQFCLATVDPNGNPTDGITRYGTNTSMANNSGRTQVISETRWPREQYMNIWSAPNLPFLGLASVPNTSGVPNNPNQDFILVASSTFGGPGFGTNAPYNLGRTTTHEVGHWLGLFHVWGNGGCSSDDGIGDTPIQQGSNFGCPNHPSPSCGNSGDMFMNYMDYVDDACMHAFSIEQGQYMNTILNTSRASLQGSAATACAFVTPLILNVLDQSDPNCSDSNDGFILVEASGGSPSYSYAIDGGTPVTNGLFTDLTGGSHTVEVFDSDGLTTSVTVFLNTPLPLTGDVEITATNPCSDQSVAEIIIQTSGGTNPYFYSVDMSNNQQTNVFDELSNGFHVYLITDDNGCTTEGTFEITGSDDVDITMINNQSPTCFGFEDGMIEIIAEGGSGTLSYNINEGSNQNENIFENLSSGEYLVYAIDSLGCFDSLSVQIEQPDEVEILVMTTDPPCNGVDEGEISINASGGTGSTYAYSLNGEMQNDSVISSLASGTYFVSASDSLGCIDTVSVDIIEPELLVAEVMKVFDVSCSNIANGIAEITVSGGTESYKYIMNNDTLSSNILSDLDQGDYNVTIIDANECSTEVNFTIGYSQTIQIEHEVTDVSCNGYEDGSVFINAINTMGDVLYSLNGGTPQSVSEFYNLPIGEYQVVVSDNSGCDGSSSFSITEPTELVNIVEVTKDVSCFGGSDGQATFTTSGGTGLYFYQFDVNNPDPNGLVAGEYNLTVTDDNGCAVVNTFTITEPEELVLSFSYEPNTLVLEVTGGTEPYEYSFDEGVTYGTENTYETSSSNISVSIRDANDCLLEETILINDVKNIGNEWSVNSYPVPFRDILNLHLELNNPIKASIQIFDINGRLKHNISAKNYPSGENFVKIDARNFASSIYIVKIASAEGYRYIKVIKK